MDAIAPYIDVSKTSLFLSLGAIAFNPTAWNIVARNGWWCIEADSIRRADDAG